MIKTNKTPIVGSYHKTGTCLIKEIFQIYSKQAKEKVKFTNNFHSIKLKDLENRKSLAVIRHPYEIILSGVRYHSTGKEDWLHKKTKNKKSYFENLQSLESLEEKINFEANHIAKSTIWAIYEDVINKKETLFIKIENFWTNEERKKNAIKMANHLELNSKILIPIILETGSKKTNFTNPNFSYTWPNCMTDENIKFINEILPKDVFEVLGYE